MKFQGKNFRRTVSGIAISTAACAMLSQALLGQDSGRAPGCYIAGGSAAFEQGDMDLAEREFRAALRAFPGFLEARENLAITLARKGRVGEAVAEFTEVLADRPNWAEAHYNLGLLQLEAKNLNEALIHFGRAVELNPAYPEAHNNFGLALEQQGKIDEAIAEFRTAIEFNPHSTPNTQKHGTTSASSWRKRGKRNRPLRNTRLHWKLDLIFPKLT